MVFDKHDKSLQRRFSRLVVATIGVASVLYVVWSAADQESLVQYAALTEARALSAQMQASWEYIGSIQDSINYDSSGNYSFKGIYCATAAKQIAESFTNGSSGYVFRYVRHNPRNPNDTPDNFESDAIDAFQSTGRVEAYGMSAYENERVFRYVTALFVEESCLPCHGDPAGSRDETGLFREGMRVGDLAGASSIVIPIKDHQGKAVERGVVTVVFFGLLILVMVLVVKRALKLWVVRPMKEANDLLAESNAAKSKTLTLVSHELRTPLASIIAFTDIWQNSKVRHDPEEEYLVDEVKRSGESLLHMVNNIIDMAKVESGKYETCIEEVDVLDVVGVVKSTAEPIAIRKGIDLRFELAPDTPIVLSDWEAIRKILLNLVSNAIKFTESEGVVTIKTACGDDGTLLISVEDMGCGIPEEDLDRIFEQYEQVSTTGSSSRNKENQGSGLGLSLSRELAEMVGGTLRAKSVLGKGSLFVLTLPRTAFEGLSEDAPDDAGQHDGR